MNALTYSDLLYIRDLLIADQSAKKEILGKVETMLGEHAYQPLTMLNAKTIAALNEPAVGIAHSVDELMEALLSDE